MGFSYPEVGATRIEAPAGYQVHRERFALGSGPGAFERARQAVREWRMFEMAWLELCWPDAQIWLCLGHSSGEHAESGEEWFGVEQRDDQSVWYEVLAFSREKHVLAKIGYLFTRWLQRKFRRDSGLAMQRTVADS